MDKMIVLKKVSKLYEHKSHAPLAAVRETDLVADRGEFVVITGRSGSGKTTLLNLVAGLAKPSSGQVILDGTDLWTLSDARQARLRNSKIGFVFQFPSLLPSLTVLENVVFPVSPKNQDEKRHLIEFAKKRLEEVGLMDKMASFPRQLSAGQQQRAVIARALINQPELILADEPTSNLDEQSEKEIMALFQDIHSHGNITILLVTHTEQLVAHGTRRIHMSGGSIDQDEPI